MARNTVPPVSEQPSLSPEFESLWPQFEGQRITKVIMTFAGEVDLSADQDLCQALHYLDEVEFTIRGRITGKKFSLKGVETVGNATTTILAIRAGGGLIMTKAGERAEAAKDVTPKAPKARKDAVWEDIDRIAAEAEAAAGDEDAERALLEAGDGEPFE